VLALGINPFRYTRSRASTGVHMHIDTLEAPTSAAPLSAEEEQHLVSMMSSLAVRASNDVLAASFPSAAVRWLAGMMQR
jgi:hypothetical protein